MRIKEPFWNYSDLAIFLGLILPSLLVTVLIMGLLRSAPKAVALITAQSAMYVVLFVGLYLVLKTDIARPCGKGWGG